MSSHLKLTQKGHLTPSSSSSVASVATSLGEGVVVVAAAADEDGFGSDASGDEEFEDEQTGGLLSSIGGEMGLLFFRRFCLL